MILAMVCALAPSLGFAQTFTAENQLQVVPLNAAEFEVIEARGEGARGIWCAASDYAQRRLGLSRGGRIYVKTARGPSISGLGRKGVVFTADPQRLPVPPRTSVSVSVRNVGQGLPIQHAYLFCRDYQIELRDTF
ncbi:MAG: hypothetical protein ACJAVM_002101 [Sulfitobacter sp.]|jgi:hypothetical protein